MRPGAPNATVKASGNYRIGATAVEHTVRADIFPGGTFPDYELTDHTKTRRRLSELQGSTR